MPASVAKLLNPRRFAIEDDADNTDYVLCVEKLATYSGPELGAKRRQVNQFLRATPKHAMTILDLKSEKIVTEIDELYQLWQHQKSAGGAKDNEHEYIALKRCINSADELDLFAAGLYVGEKLVAFWILGILDSGNSISHFEKADTFSHQFVFAFFKMHVAQLLHQRGIKYINLEQDLGIAGLRRSKNSYAPKMLLQKYIVRAL